MAARQQHPTPTYIWEMGAGWGAAGWSLWFVQEQVEAVRDPSCHSFYGEAEVKTHQSESEEGRATLRESCDSGRASCICWEFESCVFIRAAGALERCKESPALCWHCRCPLCCHCQCPLCRQCHHPAPCHGQQGPVETPGWAQGLGVLYRRERRSLSTT